MQFIYPVIARKTEDGTFACRVPDLTGCSTVGDTLDEAMEELHYAAENWISVELEDDNAVLPRVTDPEDLTLSEGEFVRQVCITIRFTEGWEE